MTFEESVEKYLDEHGDFGTAMNFGRAMYEAGKAASRRPRAAVLRVGNAWTIIKSGPCSDTATQLIRGGFVTSVDAKEWARSNGFEVC